MKNFIRYCILTLILLLGVAVYSAIDIYEQNLCDDEPSRKEYRMYSGLLQSLSRSSGSASLRHDKKNCVENRTRYDAREIGIVPPVRNRACDACWAYAAIGIMECSYLKVNRGIKPWTVDFSEKQLLVCGRPKGNKVRCKGNMLMAMNYLRSEGVRVMAERSLYENGFEGDCPDIDSTAQLQMVEWGMVDGERFNRIAQRTKIKEAICRYGSIAASMNSTDTFINFKGDAPFSEMKSNIGMKAPPANHVVVIIGWDNDKEAWLVRNCWGTDWGMNGYAWVKYTTNNIGVRAIWVVAQKTSMLKF